MSSAFSRAVGRPVSRVAFGASRLGEPRGAAEHGASTAAEAAEAALAHALRRGVTVIDTAASASRGASEEAIGRVLESADCDRDSISVVSKFGYRLSEQPVAPEASPDADAALPPCSVPISPGVVSCFDPDFLRSELTASLERLGSDSVEAYLLHDPESHLEHALPLKAGADLDEASVKSANDAFMSDVILPSFVALEQEVSRAG